MMMRMSTDEGFLVEVAERDAGWGRLEGDTGSCDFKQRGLSDNWSVS